MSTTTADYQTDRFATSALDALGAALARNWWLIALRAALGVVFGLIALIMPVATILALVLLFSAYMLVDAVFAIYAAVRAARRREWCFKASPTSLPGPSLFCGRKSPCLRLCCSSPPGRSSLAV